MRAAIRARLKGQRIPQQSIPSKRAMQRKRKMQNDLQALYAEVMDGEAILHLRLPGWQSAERMMESGLAAIVKVSMQEFAPEVALKAGMYLLDYGMRLQERAGKQIEGNAVMAQLETLYRKALPVEAEAEPLVEEEEKKP